MTSLPPRGFGDPAQAKAILAAGHPGGTTCNEGGVDWNPHFGLNGNGLLPESSSATTIRSASVKPVLDAPPNAQMNGEINHGRLTLNNARLSQIIAVAYNVQGSRVVEGPEGLDSELFHIAPISIRRKASSCAGNPDAGAGQRLVGTVEGARWPTRPDYPATMISP
jgi:hypothetical protein